MHIKWIACKINGIENLVAFRAPMSSGKKDKPKSKA